MLPGSQTQMVAPGRPWNTINMPGNLKPGYKAVMVRMGNILLDLNQLERAQTAFAEVVDTSGLEAAALYGLGQVALLQRNYDAAIAAFTRALEYDPAASRIHYPLAQALRAAHRNDEAKHNWPCSAISHRPSGTRKSRASMR